MGFPADMLFYASYDSTTDADYSKLGSTTPASTLFTTIDTSIYNCGVGSAKVDPPGSPNDGYVQYSGGGEVGQQGTIEYWFYWDSSVVANQNKRISSLDIWNGGNNNNRILMSQIYYTFFTFMRIYVSIYDSSGSIITALTAQVNPKVLDTWFHVALVFDIDTGLEKVYVDGVEIKSDTQTGSRTAITNHLYIGGTFYPVYHQYMDDVQIYNTVQYSANFTPACASFGPSNKIFNSFGSPFGSSMARGFGR